MQLIHQGLQSSIAGRFAKICACVRCSCVPRRPRTSVGVAITLTPITVPYCFEQHPPLAHAYSSCVRSTSVFIVSTMATQSKGTDHILVHSPLNEGFDRNGPSVPHYSNFFPQRHYPRNTRLQRMYPGRIPKNSFFARNNPHPGRVTHIKGLLDVPICCVQDGIFDGHRFVLSEPEIDPKLHETRLGPPRATRYSANKDKQIPAVGIGKFVYNGANGRHGNRRVLSLPQR